MLSKLKFFASFHFATQQWESNMNLRCTLNFNVLSTLLLLLVEPLVCRECESDGLNRISCIDYLKCNDLFPEGRIISCKNGRVCAGFELKLCQEKLNSYSLNECTEFGIFPDETVDSNYYVCLSDGGSGYFKYEFSCPEGNFFDKSGLTCLSRNITSVAFDDPTSPSTVTSSSSSPSTSPSPSSTTTSPLSSSPSTSPSPSATTTSPLSSSPSTSPSSSSTTTSPSPSSTTTGPLSSSPSTNPSPSSITTSPSPSSTISPTTSSTSTTTPFTSTSPESTSPNHPTESPSFVCTVSGIFPNPTNCKMYYRCSTSHKAFAYICPGTSYFNENILKCSLIITPACQEQILKNSTAVPPAPTTIVTSATSASTTVLVPTSSFSTSSTTTTTTPTISTPQTTKITITTVNPVSSTPVSCVTEGTVANPSDCKTYYRCSSSGKIFRFFCPGNSYFNEFTKRCSLIITPRCENLISG